MKRQRKFRDHFETGEPTYERALGKEKTVPDESMTVSEIISRVNKGLPVTGVKVPLYDPEGELPDFRRMDLSEIHDLKQRLKQTEQRIRQELNQIQEDEDEKKRQDYYFKKFNKEQQQKDALVKAQPGNNEPAQS